jgi:hypothetical protein
MSSGTGQLDGSAYPFKSRRRRDKGGARTRKDNRRARHTSAEAARPVLINGTGDSLFLWMNSGFCMLQWSLCATVSGYSSSVWILVCCSTWRVGRAALILQSAMASRRNKDADSDTLRGWRYWWSDYWMLILFWEREVFRLINYLDLHARG